MDSGEGWVPVKTGPVNKYSLSQENLLIRESHEGSRLESSRGKRDHIFERKGAVRRRASVSWGFGSGRSSKRRRTDGRTDGRTGKASEKEGKKLGPPAE